MTEKQNDEKPTYEIDTEMPVMFHDVMTNALSFGRHIIGEMDLEENTLTLNAGWVRLAGLSLTIQGDPAHDRKRVVFERPVGDHRLVDGA